MKPFKHCPAIFFAAFVLITCAARLESADIQRDSLREIARTDDWLGAMEKTLALLKGDLDSLRSKQTVASRSASLTSLKKDLELLLEIQQLRPPDDPSPSLDILKEWRPESLGYGERFLENQREIVRLRDQILR